MDLQHPGDAIAIVNMFNRTKVEILIKYKQRAHCYKP